VGEKTGISWTDSTWNPVRGCTKVSAGCKHCYAETFAERWRGVPGHAFEQGFDLRLVPEALELPLRWKKPRRIFVNSMSDLFHEEVPNHYIRQVFEVMARCPQHTFQVLTKRPARMKAWCTENRPSQKWSLVDNIWLGVSVEDQRAADERIPELLATPAAVRFLSCEPLLGPVDLRRGVYEAPPELGGGSRGTTLQGIGWVIVGGESGPGARTCDVAWIRRLVEQCREASTACFVKQLGAKFEDREGRLYGRAAPRWENGDLRARLGDRSGADPEEWPADLRVQQFPEAR
jgi:protein gp37